MKLILEELGYTYDNRTMIWKKPTYQSINYSDGDSTENKIELAIKSVKDKSTLSQELKQYCIDWPSTYHLSSARANILRPFEEFLQGEILEIGAGCGAITRYLGERGGTVLALEGSVRRAEIAKARASDLDNVHVLAEAFHQFKSSKKFDVITLIGVLEYSNLFTPGSNPTLSVLEKAYSLLKPNGRLIIAIENQFGLKYFAGAPEDHLNIPMYGIEGRYENNQPETFGKEVLKKLLKSSGFQFIEFLAPFPDYKLPTSIITEAGCIDSEFDGSAFAWQSSRHDPQLPKYLTFSIELVWPKIFENNLALDLSNSFLICASLEQKTQTNVLAYHYTTDRKPIYCKELTIKRNDNAELVVHFRRLLNSTNGDVRENGDSPIRFVFPEAQPYIQGRLLSLELISILKKDDWTIEQVADFTKRYLKLLTNITGIVILSEGLIDKNTLTPNWCFDLIPQNILITNEGEPKVIDVEWHLSNPMPLGYLLFRAILNVINKISRFGLHVHRHPFTRKYFLFRAIRDAGVDIEESDIDEYTNIESIIQHNVTGRPSEYFLNWNENELINTKNLNTSHNDLEQQLIETSKLIEISAGNYPYIDSGIEKIKSEISFFNETLKENIEYNKENSKKLDAMHSNTNKIIDFYGESGAFFNGLAELIDASNASSKNQIFELHQKNIANFKLLSDTTEAGNVLLKSSLSNLYQEDGQFLKNISKIVELSNNALKNILTDAQQENTAVFKELSGVIEISNISLKNSLSEMHQEDRSFFKELSKNIEESNISLRNSIFDFLKTIESKDKIIDLWQEKFNALDASAENLKQELNYQKRVIQEKEIFIEDQIKAYEDLKVINDNLSAEIIKIKSSKYWKFFNLNKI